MAAAAAAGLAATGKVDEALARYRDDHDIESIWPVRERVVVALTGGPEQETLLRRGARLAGRGAGGELYAVQVLADSGLRDVRPESAAMTRQLVTELGGTMHIVTGSDVGEAILAFALIVVFGFAMIWWGIFVGSLMRSVEAVNGVMFTILFPITFVANTFVPTGPMPTWLRTIAEWNPISSLVQSLRVLWGNGPDAAPGAAFPLHHPEIATLLWSIGLTVIIAPFALRAYHRRTTD